MNGSNCNKSMNYVTDVSMEVNGANNMTKAYVKLASQSKKEELRKI